MPSVELGDATIYYEERGSGFPILLIAPGGMRSAVPMWRHAPWDPIEQLSANYRVIAMDQRNAGKSRAPIRSGDGWESYTRDQLALMDHLGIDRFHVGGMCIGGSYGFGLIKAAPERVASAVLFQPIGLDGNRQAFLDMFDAWANELRPQHPEVTDATWTAFRDAMYGGDFVFTADRAFVSACRTPILILLGNDQYHPQSTSREIVQLAPNAELVERWKDADDHDAARKAIDAFLAAHTDELAAR